VACIGIGEEQAHEVVLHRRECAACPDLVVALAVGEAPIGEELGDVAHRGGEVHRQDFRVDVLADRQHRAPGEILDLGPALLAFDVLLDTPSLRPL